MIGPGATRGFACAASALISGTGKPAALNAAAITSLGSNAPDGVREEDCCSGSLSEAARVVISANASSGIAVGCKVSPAGVGLLASFDALSPQKVAIRRVEEIPTGMKNGATAPQLSGPAPTAIG